MNHIQRQSILITIQGIEHQLQSLKSLLSLKEDPVSASGLPMKSKSAFGRYTTDEEDLLIEGVLKAEADKQSEMMQNAFKAAQEMTEHDGD